MFQINYKECKFAIEGLKTSVGNRFRLTIRNVNPNDTVGLTIRWTSFRLTIRNVNEVTLELMLADYNVLD